MTKKTKTTPFGRLRSQTVLRLHAVYTTILGRGLRTGATIYFSNDQLVDLFKRRDLCTDAQPSLGDSLDPFRVHFEHFTGHTYRATRISGGLEITRLA